MNMKNSFATMDTSQVNQAVQAFLSRVYAWMVAGLLITGLTAWYVYDSGLWYKIVSSGMFWFLIIGELVVVWTLSSRINKFSTNMAGGLFVLYSVLNGLTLSVIFAAYTSETIQEVFFIAAAMFAGLSLFGYTTKRDLSGVGRFMMMGLIGLIGAFLFQLIFGRFAPLNFAISLIGVVIFAGLTAYDTQKIKEMYISQMEHDAIASKGAIIGALTLYLDFINLFLFLLRLFGNRN